MTLPSKKPAHTSTFYEGLRRVCEAHTMATFMEPSSSPEDRADAKTFLLEVGASAADPATLEKIRAMSDADLETEIARLVPSEWVADLYADHDPELPLYSTGEHPALVNLAELADHRFKRAREAQLKLAAYAKEHGRGTSVHRCVVCNGPCREAASNAPQRIEATLVSAPAPAAKDATTATPAVPPMMPVLSPPQPPARPERAQLIEIDDITREELIEVDHAAIKRSERAHAALVLPRLEAERLRVRAHEQSLPGYPVKMDALTHTIEATRAVATGGFTFERHNWAASAAALLGVPVEKL